MAPIIDMLTDIIPTKTKWAFRDRVVRLWKNLTFGKSDDICSLEMVLIDRDGTRIHASVKRNLIKTFKPIIREGVLYVMRDFVIGYNNSKYKASSHRYKLNFMMKTYVKEVEDSSFPYHIYNFIPFGHLLSASKIDENKLIDVIGEVVRINTVHSKEISGRSTRMIDILLQDIENNRLSCTIWSEQSDELSNVLDTKNPEPAILLLQTCRAKKFRGGGCDVKSIDQLLDSSEVGHCWIYVTIVAVENDRNWCYLSYKKYLKNVNPIKTRFHCEKCDNFSADGILRFKVQLRDSTSDNEVNMPTKRHQKPLSLDELKPSNKAKRTLDIYSSTQLSSNKSRRIIKQEKP
ncbi:unnamed protein product [Fraxinus pennsylvanica]|uniref:Replication protein A 70 kDa DNA-binding subunit B/D first OB fold domain-containing protein n=1 Tax=Fraxinus pennsylvanica TaxID=56036 RepID=A0AAD2ECA3_9LAMI|nr:unnamed protein product [Fraxinus pennsylvanica]